MMRTSSIIALLLTSLPGAGAIAQASPGAGPHEISGIVVSAKSGEPLANTSVTLIQSSTRKMIEEALTDTAGRFRFPSVADGKYDLLAARKGYVASAYQQHEGGINTAIVTGDGLISTGLLFELQPQGRIFGTVQEDSGDPVPSAQIKLFQRDVYRGTGRMIAVRGDNADSMGNFEVTSLSPGKYILCVIGTPWYALPRRSFPGMQPAGEANGLARLNVLYAPTCYPDTTDPGEAEPITLGAGEQVSMNITLHPVPAIHLSMPIAMSDANGQPAFQPPQVTADMFGTSQFLSAQVSITRENPSGPYTADIEVPPGQYGLTFPGVNGEPARHMNINTEAGTPTLTPTTADTDSMLTGIVQVEDGEALPRNSVVWFEPKHGDAPAASALKPDGTFTVESLHPGVYSLGVSSLPIARLSAKGAQLHGHLLTITGEPVQLNIVLRQASATLNGVVKQNGTPVSGVFVLLVPTGPQQIGDRAIPNQSDSDGTFNFRQIAPGDYTLVAIDKGWTLDWANGETIRPYLIRGQRVRVEPQTREVNLKEPLQPLPLNLK